MQQVACNRLHMGKVMFHVKQLAVSIGDSEEDEETRIQCRQGVSTADWQRSSGCPKNTPHKSTPPLTIKHIIQLKKHHKPRPYHLRGCSSAHSE